MTDNRSTTLFIQIDTMECLSMSQYTASDLSHMWGAFLNPSLAQLNSIPNQTEHN